MAEISQALAADILTLPDLSDPDWDTYSMVAEVTDYLGDHDGVPLHRVRTPVPTAEPVNSWPFIQLRNKHPRPRRGRRGTWSC